MQFDIMYFEALKANQDLGRKSYHSLRVACCQKDFSKSMKSPDTCRPSEKPDILPDIITTKTHSVYRLNTHERDQKEHRDPWKCRYDHFALLMGYNITSAEAHCVNAVAQTCHHQQIVCTATRV